MLCDKENVKHWKESSSHASQQVTLAFSWHYGGENDFIRTLAEHDEGKLIRKHDLSSVRWNNNVGQLPNSVKPLVFHG